MDMHVEAAGGDDLAFTGDHFGTGTDDDRDAGLDIGIAGLADGGDPPVPDADIGFDDAPVIDDQRVGDDGIDGAVPARHLRLAHAVADDLAAAELHFLAVDRVVGFDLHDQFGIGKADAVAGRGAEHGGIVAAVDTIGHGGRLP